MARIRINPERPLTNAEKQARQYLKAKEARLHVLALERALCDAADAKNRGWIKQHATTIARARASQEEIAHT